MDIKEKRRRAFIYVGLILIAFMAIIFIVLTIFTKNSVELPSNLASVSNNRIEGDVASADASEEYNSMIRQHDDAQASNALNAGESYFSIPTAQGNQPIEPETPEPLVVESPPQPSVVMREEVPPPPRITFTQDELERMMDAIALLDEQLHSQINLGEISYIATFEEETVENAYPENFPQSSQSNIFKSGDIYYAIVDTAINSDVNSAVMATVVAGNQRSTKFIGSFARFEERIVIQFSRAILPDGTEYPIEAYAIDPETTEASVASQVDTHFFSRWGGLIAASFLQGFGEATQFSGAQTVDSVLGEPTGQVLFSEYSLAEQALIAAGKVGESASEVFAQNFNRPPTVYLNMGSPIGILIIKSES